MSYDVIEATVEEFYSGSWVADLVATQSFSGSFMLNDGSQWTGTKLTERNELLYHTRIVGGAGKLSTVIDDKFYSGNVSLQVAVGDICSEGGETLGTVAPGVFLSTYQRQKGTVAQALDQLASEFSMIWWIDRTGLVNMNTARSSAPDATGNRISVDSDASIVLSEPSGVVIGASYDSTDSTAAMSSIQHVRWRQTSDKFTAEIYPLPFIFRAPTLTVYERIYNARVDKDNGDGTIDVIVDARFGMQKVPFFCGVPHAKTKFDGGEQVSVGFFAGNPNAPFAMSTAQDTTATKQVARVQDSVNVGTIELIIGGTATLTGTYTAPDGTETAIATGTPFAVSGVISSGTSRIAVGD